MDNKPETISEIKEFFEEFVKAYPKENVDRYLNLFAKDSDLVVFGTGAKWVGYEEEYKFAPAEEKERFDDIALKIDWIRINSCGNIAWVAADVTVNLKIGEQEIVTPARLSGVLKKTEGKWVIVQGHISVIPT
jgi:uncharacterized protein (TIGR02246 family)